MPEAAPCRLHLLKATEAPVACVIRRGPSSWFHIALWHYDAGIVEHGAWTKIKLYPERCGISPDGKRLAVFALGGEWGTYFAVSRAPWLHALAAWRTVGTWTTGADFEPDGTIVLAGCSGETPLHGAYPDPVVCQPIDTHWVQARLFRELRTGWELAALKRGGVAQRVAEPWVEELPSPIDLHPDSVVATKPAGNSTDRALVLVSLHERHREYYLRDGGRLLELPDVTVAEWATDGRIIAATRTGLLRIHDASLATAWEYDMNTVTPDPAPAPAWATVWW